MGVGAPAGRRRARASGARIALALLLVLPGLPVLGVPAVAASPGAPAERPSAGAAGGGAALPTPPASSAYDWPEFHRSAMLRGYADNAFLGTNNASRLGVAWATDLQGAALDSPVVAFDAALGKTLAYVGTESGDLEAVDVATGHIVWSEWLGSPIRSTPIVWSGSVFAATFGNPEIIRLDASNGTPICHAIAPMPVEGTPVIATPPGGVATLYVGTNDARSTPGPLLAITARNCSIRWSFTAYHVLSGSWDPVAYAVDATGRPLVVFGSADPDSSVYAVDARNGSLVWRFQTRNPGSGAFDVGAGAAIAPPGTLGYWGGTAFVPNKAGILYALDLTNGTARWNLSFAPASGPVPSMGRSTPALEGTHVVLGTYAGLLDVNASSGLVRWNVSDPTRTEEIAAPAIGGPAGRAVVIGADLGGDLTVSSLATGKLLYRYATGGYVTASPAVSGSRILLPSSDGLLYCFAVGGGRVPVLPSSSISYPAPGGSVRAVAGNVTVRGNASDPSGVSGVSVAVRASGPDGPWWDATRSIWSPGPIDDAANVSAAGGRNVSWSFRFPVPPYGGNFEVVAGAIAVGGQPQIRAVSTSFDVLGPIAGPHVRPSVATVAPGGTFAVSGGGFAPNETVNISLGGGANATGTTDAHGTFIAVRLPVASNASFGPTAIIAHGTTSGRTATAEVEIANAWATLGGTASESNFLPNDRGLNAHVFVGGPTWLYEAWHFDAGDALNGSPAVAGGAAYIVDQNGTLYAIATSNGGLRWSVGGSSALRFGPSPAVDPALGLVLASTLGGRLEARWSTNGSLAWNRSLAFLPSAPVLNGSLILLSSAAGTVAAYDAASGAMLWSKNLTGRNLTVPAEDAAVGEVVVGDASGVVTALRASNGTALWTFAANGSLLGPPEVRGGVVYLATSTGHVDALAESTGHRLWQFSARTSFRSAGSAPGPLARGGDLLLGGSNGEVYALNLSTGKIDFQETVKGGVLGIASVTGVFVGETATGEVFASRSYTPLLLWRFASGTQPTGYPVIVDDAVYVAGADGFLDAWTTFGQAPD